MSKLKLSEKAKLQKDTEELLTAVLPIPKEVTAFYKKRVEPSIGKGYEFAEVITKRKGRLLQRVFCFQLHGLGGKKPSVRECARRYEGGSLLVSNMKGGWYTQPYLADDDYVGEDMHPSGWVPKYAINCGKKNFSFTTPWICLNESKWLKEYPYCAWEQYKGGMSFWQYLVKYRKSGNKIEMLVKAGYSNFVGTANLLNINGKTFEQIFKVKQPFAKEYLKTGNSRDLIILRNNEWINSASTLNKYKQIIYDRYYSKGLTEEEIKYIALSNGSVHDYKDYLGFAKKLAYPLNEKRYRFPEDLRTAHDNASQELKDIEQKVHDDAIRKLSEACQSFCFEKDGYCIFPLSCSQDLIKESDTLKHCVRQYVNACADNKSLILFVRKIEDKDTPYVTVELVKSKEGASSKPLNKQFDKITQVYGFKDSDPDAETCQFVLDWKKKFKLKGWKATA